MLDDIINVAQKSNLESLSCHLYEENGGRYSREPIEREFGSYQNAFKEAGLKEHINKRKKH